jgi:hypothetical protein
MQHIVYTHKNVQFEWIGGLNVRLPTDFLPLDKKYCNGQLYWQISKNVRLSINQLKKIINENRN